MYIACVALILVLGKYFNFLRVKNETLRLENRFTELNSSLYLLAQKGEVSFADDQFKYLQRGLNTAGIVLPKMNFWVLALMTFKTRKNASQTSYLDFEKTFTHPEMRVILNEYTKRCYNYFFSKNFFAICTFFISLKFVAMITKALHKARGLGFRQYFKRNFKFIIIMNENEYGTRVCYSQNNNRVRNSRSEVIHS